MSNERTVTDFRSLCAELVEAIFEDNRFWEENLMEIGNRARAALAEPEPEGQTPPDYIDPEHTGADRELLQAFYAACQSEGGTVDEVTLRGLRAAIAADRAQRQPVPPEPGEVQELVEWLRDNAKDEREMSNGANPASMNLDRAAELLSQCYPQPVPGSEWQTGLPPSAGFYYVRGLLNESIGGDNRPVFVNPKDFVWGFWELDDPEWIGLDSDITPESIQWKPVSSTSHPVPVPMSERLPGPGDCDEEGRCWWWDRYEGCWWYLKPISSEQALQSWSWTHWLTAHALPLPVEVDHD